MKQIIKVFLSIISIINIFIYLIFFKIFKLLTKKKIILCFLTDTGRGIKQNLELLNYLFRNHREYKIILIYDFFFKKKLLNYINSRFIKYLRGCDIILTFNQNRIFHSSVKSIYIVGDIYDTFHYTGQRSLDIFGLRWEAPSSDEEKDSCSGWLLEGWENSDRPTLHFWTTKTHKPADIHIDQESLSTLKRLREANLREKNKWALKSPFVFPQKKNPLKHVTYSSYQKHLTKLNSTLGFERLEGDNISRVRGKRKIFSFKIARKTFATEVARNKGGIELAARKLNYSSSAVTRRNYIVPDDKEMIIENLYEKNLPEKDVAVVVESPWNKKLLANKE